MGIHNQPGHKKVGGRKKGTPNKATTQVKAAILAAFDELGGVEYLVKQGRENPQIFCSLLGKVMPSQVNMTTGKDIQIVIQRPDGHKSDSPSG